MIIPTAKNWPPIFEDKDLPLEWDVDQSNEELRYISPVAFDMD